MDWLQALVLGLIQGLTEYLPVSSSGHLAIGANLFGMSGEENLTFTVAVHVATVLSTVVILWKEIVWIFADIFKWKWNEGMKYAVNICLMITASLLAFSYWAKPRQRENISPFHAFVIGIAQALAVLPGLSRSGSTIATGLLLGNKKEKLAQFSFLMVIPPILGEALLDVKDMAEVGVSQAMAGLSPVALAIGFLAAFVSGCLACKWMINIVKKGKLIWFAAYCVVAGIFAIILNYTL